MSIGDLIRLDLANRGSVRYDDSPELRTWEEVQDWFWNRPPRQKSIRCKLFGHYETLRYRDRFTYLECDRCGAAKRPPCFEEDD